VDQHREREKDVSRMVNAFNDIPGNKSVKRKTDKKKLKM
jgi:hypothetical protein